MKDVEALPLAGLTVVDLGMGMAAALTAKFLAEAGATVRRLEPPGGDPFYDVYPAYAAWRSCLADIGAQSDERERELLDGADICILGGEDFPAHETRHEADALTDRYPRLITVDISATLPDSRLEQVHAADILIQARAGLVFETYPDRPAVMGFVPSAYGATLMALIAVSAALYRRECSGRGQVVRAGLLEGALAWLTPYWGRAERETPHYLFNVPRGARPLILRTRDGAYVHVVLGSIGSKYRLYKILGIEDPSIEPSDPGLPNPGSSPDVYFGDVDVLALHAARMESDQLLEALRRDGVVAERVLESGSAFDDPQVRHNGIVSRSADGMDHVGQPIDWKISKGAVRPSLPTSTDRAPLEGIQVIDFGAFVAGPSASVGLADLGADVIKVEPPRGDPLRGMYRFYAAANRGKRSIAIEMKNAEGLALAHRLARRADIVCSNFKVGAAERLGIDAATLQSSQPDKIVVFNTGYGVDGPKANSPAFDPCMQATSGLEMRSGGKGNPPTLNRTMMVDFCGGLLAQVGAMMALYRRARDGSGSAVTVPLLHASLFLMSDIVRSSNGEIHGPTSLSARQTGYHPSEMLYETRDGWIAVAARGEPTARAMASALALPDQAIRHSTEWSDAEMAAFSAAFQRMTLAEALALMARAGVPAERCRETAEREFIDDDHFVETGLVYEVERRELGRTRGLGRLYALSAASPKPSGVLSSLSEDSRAIMVGIGFSSVEIDALHRAKVVRG